MRREIGLRPVLALICLLGSSAAPAASQDSPADAKARLAATFTQEILPFLKTYCFNCHGVLKPKADLNLAQYFTSERALSKLSIWKECATKVQALEMPPKKEKQPISIERDRFIAWVNGFKQLYPKDPGRGTIRRLSQVEYANTLADLFGVDPKLADEVPRDEVGAGFNSSIPPLLMEKYLSVADAVLDEVIKPDQLKAKWSGSQLAVVVDGKKIEGTRDAAERRLSGPGEVTGLFIVPAEGTYTINIKAAAEKSTAREPSKLAIRLNGEAVGEVKVTAVPPSPGLYTVTCKLLPGSASLSVVTANPYVEAAPAPKAPPPAPAKPATPGAKPEPPPPPPPADKPAPRVLVLDSVEVVGPPAARQSPLQKKIFVAVPGKDLSPRDAAKKIAESFGRRAFRRPPSAGEIDALLKVFDLADSKRAAFSESVRLMIKAALVSPSFLYLTPDDGTASGPEGSVAALGDHQLASRLSYLFWSTMPDDELAGLADAGKLKDPSVIASQVRRLIADPRSKALFEGFGAAWLGIDRLGELEVDEKKFPLLAKPVRKAMLEEASLLFDTILKGNQSILEFIDASYTFMNELNAKIYGMDATVKGPKMIRVALTDRNRGGILTLPGVLAVTSLPNRTSPVKRGRWVLEQVLGQTPPAPPADVPSLEKQDAAATSKLNLRQRMERHRTNPACFGCHQTIDPIGFGLENFDVAGKWREVDDTGVAVDTKGELPGGIAFSGPAELKKIVSDRKDEFCRNLVKRVLAYTLCRSLSGYDEVVADEIADDVIKDGYKFQTIWVKVATSYPFLNRRISR
ncbi:MAG: DUF1592 domain-containing protein [Planctomycetaceae bacterium]|nr:DUF1592 domain-containing protein [Planctomycetaceae bacterium]